MVFNLISLESFLTALIICSTTTIGVVETVKKNTAKKHRLKLVVVLSIIIGCLSGYLMIPKTEIMKLAVFMVLWCTMIMATSTICYDVAIKRLKNFVSIAKIPGMKKGNNDNELEDKKDFFKNR